MSGFQPLTKLSLNKIEKLVIMMMGKQGFKSWKLDRDEHNALVYVISTLIDASYDQGVRANEE